ncbi:MAG: hypothetical protein ACOCTQ_03115 [Planctomycetota bacterium]
MARCPSDLTSPGNDSAKVKSAGMAGALRKPFAQVAIDGECRVSDPEKVLSGPGLWTLRLS